MELRDAVHNFVDQAREIMERLRTSEGEALSGPDLHILDSGGTTLFAWKSSESVNSAAWTFYLAACYGF